MASSPIRILFADLPRSARTRFVAVIAEQPDMEIVGYAEAGDDLSASAALVEAEFVIVGLEGTTLPYAADELFERRGRLKVIGIAESDGDAYLYRLLPERDYLGESSAEEITSAIRLVAGAA